jgi:hypothetical protein
LPHRFVDQQLQQPVEPAALRAPGLLAEDVPLADREAEQQRAPGLGLVRLETALPEELRQVRDPLPVAFREHRAHPRVAAGPGADRHLHPRQRIARRHVDGDLRQEVQLLGGTVPLGLHIADDVAGGVVAPVLDHGLQKILAILEVPVEAALADLQRPSERLHRHRLHALVDQHLKGRPDPILPIQPLPRLKSNVHTAPY